MRHVRPAVLAALALLSGCSATTSAPPRQAILILLDAARPDRFSAYGYERETTPEIDRLAARGVVFERHFAQGTSTRVSVPSYLFSRYFSAPIFPNSRHVPFSRPGDLFQRNDDASISFVKVFEEAGFLTAAISAHNWTGEDTPFAAEFVETHDLVARLGAGRYGYPRAEAVVDFAIEWIDAHRDDDFFLYIHLMDTHFPHFLDEDAREFLGVGSFDPDRFTEGGLPRDPGRPLSEADQRYLDALYDGSLRYADRELGRLFDRLRSAGTLDDTLIGITSDHGENLLDGPGTAEQHGTSVVTHGGPWFDPVARVPLILHQPRTLAPARFERISEGVDLGPTLLGLAGVGLPPGKALDGVDLVAVLDSRQPARDRALCRQGIRTPEAKCLFDAPDELLLAAEAPDPATLSGSLFDLRSDPGETTDLFRERPDQVASMLRQYREAMSRPYRRFVAARTSSQPGSAFAVAAKHFGEENTWERSRIGNDECVVGDDPARPLQVEFPLPDGRYELSVKLRGAAVVEVGSLLRELRGIGREMPTFGDVDVREQTFRATIHAGADGPASVCFLGFRPAQADVDEELERERLERLRTLGYVQ